MHDPLNVKFVILFFISAGRDNALYPTDVF